MEGFHGGDQRLLSVAVDNVHHGGGALQHLAEGADNLFHAQIVYVKAVQILIQILALFQLEVGPAGGDGLVFQQHGLFHRFDAVQRQQDKCAVIPGGLDVIFHTADGDVFDLFEEAFVAVVVNLQLATDTVGVEHLAAFQNIHEDPPYFSSFSIRSQARGTNRPEARALCSLKTTLPLSMGCLLENRAKGTGSATWVSRHRGVGWSGMTSTA